MKVLLMMSFFDLDLSLVIIMFMRYVGVENMA